MSSLTKNNWISIAAIGLAAVSIIFVGCDTKSLNSITADTVGGQTAAAKVTEGATDFQIVDLKTTATTATVFFNRQYPEAIGNVQVGIYSNFDCTGTPAYELAKVSGTVKKELNISKLTFKNSYICAWEVSANGKIRNPAANNGVDLAKGVASTTSNSSSTSSSGASPTAEATFGSSLHLVTNGPTSVTLGWLQGSTDSTKIAGYQMYRSDDNGVTYTKIVDINAGLLSATVSGLFAQTTYQFKVAMLMTDTTLAYSGAVSVTTTPSPPGQVTGVVATAGSSAITLSWNAVSSATQYDIYYGTSTGVTTSSTKIANVTSPYVHTVTNGVQTYYIVVAVNAGGNGVSSSEVSATALFVAPPVPTTNSVSNLAQTSLRMNWASAGGSSNDYIIKCQSGSSAPATSTGGTVTSNTYFDYTSLSANATYTCSVWSRNANASPGLSSTYLVIQGTTLALPIVAITSPAANSYIGNANKASFAVSGTCSESGRAVTLSGAATGSATCAGGAWTATLDFSAQADGNVTINADHSSASGSNASQSARIFIKDIVPPPTLTTFAAVTHTINSGANTLTLTLPGTTADYNNIKTYRSAASITTGTTAPACGSGTLVSTTTNFASSPVVLSDSGLTPQYYYAYRVCIYDAAGNMENSKTAVDVRAKGYTWNYWYSAEDADGDGTISSGDISGSTATTWVDKSGNARNATLNNYDFNGTTSGWLGTGTIGSPYRLRCDGVNDYVSLAATSTNRTYAFWLKPESLFQGGMFGLNNWSNFQFAFYNTQTIGFAGGGTPAGGSTGFTSLPYFPGQWQHILITNDGTTDYIYKNGVPMGSFSAIQDGAAVMKLCTGYSNVDYSNASVGEVMAGPATLTESDVRNLYEGSRGKYFTAPVVPTVEKILPSTGPIAGGTAVKVYGYLLSTTTAVTVGGNSASFVLGTDGFLRFTTPAGSAGFQDILITNSLGNVTLSGAFNYNNSLTSPDIHFDAANITSTGVRGAGATNPNWSAQRFVMPELSLLNFNHNGTTSGWLGDGSVANPYRLRFDGVDDQMYMVPGSATTGYAVWFRVEAAASANKPVVGNNSYNYTPNVSYRNNMILQNYNSSSFVPQAFTRDTWYQAVQFFNGSTVDYYVNGIYVASKPATLQSIFTGNYLGTDQWFWGYLPGSIAEYVTTSGIWTEASIRAMYEGSRSRYQTAQATATIERIFPAQGPTAGGTIVRIFGWNLSGATSVTVGGAAATFAAISSGELSITTPSGSVGYQDIVINTPSGNVTKTAAFNYINPPAGALIWLDTANIDSLGSKGLGRTNQLWFNQLSTMYDAALVNFGFDSTTGWNGTGIPADPYRIKFNAASSTRLAMPAPPARTYSVWVKADSGVTASQMILRNSNGNGTGLWFSASNLNFRWNNTSSGSTQVTSAVANNTWYHVVMTFDGTSIATFYVNNVAVGSYGTSLAIDGTNDFFLGSDRDLISSLATISIGEFHSFSTSFLSTDVTTLWNMTKAKYGY